MTLATPGPKRIQICGALAIERVGQRLDTALPGRQHTRLSPLRESGYRYLMQALAAQGNLAEALAVYGQLSECLRDQLGVSPSPATRQLYQQLLAAT